MLKEGEESEGKVFGEKIESGNTKQTIKTNAIFFCFFFTSKRWVHLMHFSLTITAVISFDLSEVSVATFQQ